MFLNIYFRKLRISLYDKLIFWQVVCESNWVMYLTWVFLSVMLHLKIMHKAAEDSDTAY